MGRCQNVYGKHGIFSFFFLLFFFCNKQQDRSYFYTFPSFSLIRIFVRLKLTDTIEYMNRQGQSREDPDETMRMHRLSLTFAIRMQYALKIFFCFYKCLACWVNI